MGDALGIVVPVFIVIGLGFAAAAGGVLKERTADGLSDYVFVVAVPMLLFRTLATAPLPDVSPWTYWTAYFAGLTAAWLLMAVWARRALAADRAETTIMGFAASQSNTVFIGIPLVLQAYGQAASVPMFLLLAIHLPLTMAVATLLVETGEGAAKWRGMAWQLARHPILIGIIAGAFFRLAGLQVPAVAASAIDLIAGTAGPAALFALGMSLRRHGLTADRKPMLVTAGLKLVLHPAIVYIMAFHVLAVPPVWAGAAVIFAACPSGVNGYLLAQRYRIGVANASAAIAFTTLLSVATLSFWVAVLRPAP